MIDVNVTNQIRPRNHFGIGAHPDDFGNWRVCTIAKLSRMGYNMKLVIAVLPNFTQNDTKREERKEEA